MTSPPRVPVQGRALAGRRVLVTGGIAAMEASA
jgi:hypothetical protein